MVEFSVQLQEAKLFQYCTCPVGRVTYNFHWSCNHMYLSFKSVCNKEKKEHTCKGVISNMIYEILISVLK